MDKINKFENEQRLKELKPRLTLEKIGFKMGMSLVEVGAGTGIFSIPASQLTNKNIYALELSNDMIKILKQRKEEQSLDHLIVKKSASDHILLDESCCDMGLMVTVFHELKNRDQMIQSIKRVLKDEAKFVVIDFHKRKTPMGPPVYHRIASDAVIDAFKTADFQMTNHFSLGDNFYCLEFKK